MKREDYQEPEVKKSKPKMPSCVSPISMMDIDEMIKTISHAGYLVKKELKGGVRMTAPSCFLDVFMRKGWMPFFIRWLVKFCQFYIRFTVWRSQHDNFLF